MQRTAKIGSTRVYEKASDPTNITTKESTVFEAHLVKRVQFQKCTAASVHESDMRALDWCAIDQRGFRKFIRDILRRVPVNKSGKYLGPSEKFGGGEDRGNDIGRIGIRKESIERQRGNLAFRCLLVDIVNEPDMLIGATSKELNGMLSTWIRSNIVTPSIVCDCLNRLVPLNNVPGLEDYIYTKILGQGSYGIALRVQHKDDMKSDGIALCKTVKIILGPVAGETRNKYDHTPVEEAALQRHLAVHEIAPRILTTLDMYKVSILGRTMHMVVMESLDCTMSDYLKCVETAFPASIRKKRGDHKARMYHFDKMFNAVSGLILKMRAIRVTHMDMHTKNVMFRIRHNASSIIGEIDVARVIDAGQLATGKHDPRTDLAALLYGINMDTTRSSTRRYFLNVCRTFLIKEYPDLCRSASGSKVPCEDLSGADDIRLHLFHIMSRHIKHGKNMRLHVTREDDVCSHTSGTGTDDSVRTISASTIITADNINRVGSKVRCSGRSKLGIRCRRYTLHAQSQLYLCYSHRNASDVAT
jgi:hypothetical protein